MCNGIICILVWYTFLATRLVVHSLPLLAYLLMFPSLMVTRLSTDSAFVLVDRWHREMYVYRLGVFLLTFHISNFTRCMG
jgi:hypothetical protein